MPLPTYRTLGTLRDVLQSRLGFGATGSSGGTNRTLLNDFLYQAQKELYYLGDWVHLKTYRDATLGTAQSLLDYPATIDPMRIEMIAILINDQYVEMSEGLSLSHWSTMDTPGPPSRYERMAQVQCWPQADQSYTVRFFGLKLLPAFTADGDLPVIDDAMILLHAVTHAKEHYRQPDAVTLRKDLDLLIGSLKGVQHSVSKVYRRGQTNDFEPRPRVV